MAKKPITRFKNDYAFLSNFCIAPVHYALIEYPSVEHAYQAAKSTDPSVREKIRSAGSPAIAKRLGKRVVLRVGWDDMKLQIMESLLRQKFDHPSLRDALLETEDAELIEENYWGDVFWGVCKGQGLNHLGKLLMKIRKELKANG